MTLQLLPNWVTVFGGADAMSTELQLLLSWYTSGHHDTSVHLGRVQGPVGDPNEGHSFLSLNSLHTETYSHELRASRK